MDHIWWAPSRLKKTFALIFLEKLAILLQQDFLKTLYLHFTYTILIVCECFLISLNKRISNVYFQNFIEPDHKYSEKNSELLAALA